MAADVTVIGVGCEFDRLFGDQPPALPVPGPPERDDMQGMLDSMAGPLRRGAAVIVVIAGWLPESSIRHIRTARALLDTARVTLYVTELPPLAASAFAALAAALGPFAVSAGALAGSLWAIERELYVLAWAGSVTRLQHPSVSLAHHARSLVPGSSFGIGIQPEPFVVPIRRVREELPLPAPDHPLELLVAPGDGGDLSWIVEEVAPRLGAAVHEVAPTMHGADWWGTSRLVEAVGLPSSIEWLAQAALASDVAPCRWCGELIPAAPCPFCGEAVGPRAQGGRRADGVGADRIVQARAGPGERDD